MLPLVVHLHHLMGVFIIWCRYIRYRWRRRRRQRCIWYTYSRCVSFSMPSHSDNNNKFIPISSMYIYHWYSLMCFSNRAAQPPLVTLVHFVWQWHCRCHHLVCNFIWCVCSMHTHTWMFTTRMNITAKERARVCVRRNKESNRNGKHNEYLWWFNKNDTLFLISTRQMLARAYMNHIYTASTRCGRQQSDKFTSFFLSLLFSLRLCLFAFIDGWQFFFA